MTTKTQQTTTITVTDQRGTSATKAFRIEVSDGIYSGIGYGDSESDAFTDALISFQDNMDSAKRAAWEQFVDAFEPTSPAIAMTGAA